MELYLIRHAQTENNKNRLAQGDLDSHLNDTGIKQAKLLSTRLSSTVEFKEIVASDLLRAVETAEAIYSYQPKSSFTKASKLKERSLGEDEGKPYEYFYGKNTITGREERPSSGESINDVFYRAQSLLSELIKQYVNASYDLKINIDNLKQDIKLISPELFEEEFNKGIYTNKLIDRGPLTKIALVSHSVVIREILNNILLLNKHDIIEWMRIHNTGVFVVSIFCPNCFGKCKDSVKCNNEVVFSIDQINDDAHLNN